MSERRPWFRYARVGIPPITILVWWPASLAGWSLFLGTVVAVMFLVSALSPTMVPNRREEMALLVLVLLSSSFVFGLKRSAPCEPKKKHDGH